MHQKRTFFSAMSKINSVIKMISNELRTIAPFSHSANVRWDCADRTMLLSGVCQVSFIAFQLSFADPYPDCAAPPKDMVYTVHRASPDAWGPPRLDCPEQYMFSSCVRPTSMSTQLSVKAFLGAIRHYVSLGVDRVFLQNFPGRGISLRGTLDTGATLKKYLFAAEEPGPDETQRSTSAGEYLVLGLVNSLTAARRGTVSILTEETLLLQYQMSKKTRKILVTMHCPL